MWASLQGLPLWAVVLFAIASLLSAGGGTKAAIEAVRWWVDRRDRLEASKPSESRGITRVFRSVSRIMGAMRALRESTRGTRVVLLRASNGGQIPKPGSRLYSSVVYEDYEDGVAAVSATWQKQELDAHYVDLLVDVDREGHIYLDVEDLPGQCILGDAYQAMGVVAACVFSANGTRDSHVDYYYGSVTWTDRGDIPDPAILANAVRVARTQISAELGGSSETP